MNQERFYLRPNVVVEPLVDHWYAWSHLIPPATASLNMTGRHLKIMESYVKAPMVHAAAAKNPAMLGGPFIDYPAPRVGQIQSLIDHAKSERRDLVQLSEAIQQLDSLLRSDATGYSLEPLYAKLPEPLRGFVELVYDLNNHPSFRLVEPLLYRSRYYDPSMQSLMLALIHKDDRPFVLSTPRLAEEGDVHLRIPFRHAAVDELFRLKQVPRTFAAIKEVLELPDEDGERFRAFLTPEPPPSYEGYTGMGLRWRYFGHACILVETRGCNILLDPVLSYTYESDISRYTYQDLPDVIDFALITHNHQDHILFETMLQLRHKVRTVVVPRSGGGALQDPSLKLMLREVGFRNVVELDEMETLEFADGSITGLPFFGEHADLNIRSKLAYMVRFDHHSLLFAADSCNVEGELYKHVHEQTGDIDILFLGMECDGAPLSWLYGPLLTQPIDRKMDQSRRLSGSNYERGIDIVQRFNCKEVYVYAMGQEPWLNYIMSVKYTDQSNPIVASRKLIEDCCSRGLHAERLFGEKEIQLPARAIHQISLSGHMEGVRR
ncbi:MAG TPA: MBL fold metallo-hydrolase [Thermoanaerobaculia bacterium]|nr:MBL fold metallo-hydrolase [Thermoanaerobaculia bacterium]